MRFTALAKPSGDPLALPNGWSSTRIILMTFDQFMSRLAERAVARELKPDEAARKRLAAFLARWLAVQAARNEREPDWSPERRQTIEDGLKPLVEDVYFKVEEGKVEVATLPRSWNTLVVLQRGTRQLDAIEDLTETFLKLTLDGAVLGLDDELA